jgi:adenylate cyclase
MAERNREQQHDRRLVFRMGVHVGDIIVDGDDILGDGVNIAARLEGVAVPGGVAVSGRVYEDVVNKLDLAFEDLGSQELKNIARPVAVYALAIEAPKMERPKLALPDRPSVAVLAFENLSTDAEQEYFADGVTEDIITALSYVPWLFVIARNSSFSYKGLAVDVRKIGRELGVRYVLEGSVRRGGNRLRVTGQLVDAETGSTLATASTRSKGVLGEGQSSGNIEAAKKVGAAIAQAARERQIEQVVFNRNGFLFHGRVKALADAAREAGLQF